MTIRFFLGLAWACTLVSCSKVFDYNATVEDEPSEAEIEYPLDRLLTDGNGRNIDVSITGRGVSHVSFRKKSDNQVFDFPLEKLSERDRIFIGTLPITDNNSPKLESATPRYVKVREKELGELMEQKMKIRRDLNKTIDDVRKRSLLRDLTLLEPKIERIERQISEYWKQNPSK